MYGGVLLLGPVLVVARVAHPHLALDTELGQNTGLGAALATEHLKVQKCTNNELPAAKTFLNNIHISEECVYLFNLIYIHTISNSIKEYYGRVLKGLPVHKLCNDVDE